MKKIFLFSFLFLIFSFSLHSQSLASYQAAADAATLRLEEALSGDSVAGTKQTVKELK